MRRLLSRLVGLLPEAFRCEFGEEIHEQITEDYERAAAQGLRATLWFSVTTAGDLLASAVAERWNPTWLGGGGPATHTLARRSGSMGEGWADLKRAARSLGRAPGFTAVTVATLGLAIGVNTGIFGVVRTVLLEPLPFVDIDELVVIRGTAGPEPTYNLEDEFYLQFRDSDLFESVAFWNQFTSSLRVGDETERAWMSGPSVNIFETLGVTPRLGRLPTPEDDGRVAVLSYAFWRDRYGADPEVLGRTVFASGAELTIIAVMPPGFFFPTEDITLWIPQEVKEADIVPDVVTGVSTILARLRPGVTQAEVETELTALARRVPERFGGSPAYVRQVQDVRPLVLPLDEVLLGGVRSPLWILFAGVGVVLFIACANVANLFMVRGEDRLRESAVRRALGAGRGRLMGSLFSEAVVVAGLAGVLALLLARLCLPLILAAAPDNVPRLADVGLGPSALAFAALLSGLCALACGTVPAVRSSSPDLSRLRDGSRGSTRRRTLGRDALIAIQTALALVLLIGSALLVRSFWSLRHVDPGYDTENIFTFQIAPASEELFDGPSYARFHMSFVERLRALPGVESVGILENVPLDEGLSSGRYLREEEVGDADAGEILNYTFASGEMFGTMGIDVLDGSVFTADDLELGLKNVVVSASAADLLWPGESALGRRLVSASTGMAYTVVGVVEDILQHDFRDAPQPMFYLPLVGPTATSWAISSPGYVVRTRRAESIEPEIRALVREVAPGAPMYRAFTMADLAADSMVELSFTTLMLGIVSALALLLGAIGLYGTLSYVVAQRRREIGVRMALGAQARRVQGMVVAQGARVVLVGVGAGLAVAMVSTRVLDRLLFGVEPADAGTFLTMAAALVAVGMTASWLPALSASSVDPIESLRGD